MSTRSDAEKENERKEKRVSVDSPSSLLSPASKVLHKKARVSVPFSTKSNDSAIADAELIEHDSAVLSPLASVNASKVMLADELEMVDEGGRISLPIPIAEEPKTPANTPVPSTGPSFAGVRSRGESMRGSFVALVEDPFLDASAADTVLLDGTSNESNTFQTASFNGEQNEQTPTKDGSFRSDSTFVGEVLANDIPGTTPTQSPGSLPHLSGTKISTADGGEELQCDKKEEGINSDEKATSDQVSKAATSSHTSSCPQFEQVGEEATKRCYVASLADPLLDATAIEMTGVESIVDISAKSTSISMLNDVGDEHTAVAVIGTNDFGDMCIGNSQPTDLSDTASISSGAVCLQETKKRFDGDNMERSGDEEGRSSEDIAVERVAIALSSNLQVTEAVDSDMTQMDSGAVDSSGVGDYPNIVEQSSGADAMVATNSHIADVENVQYENGRDEGREEFVVEEAVSLEEKEGRTPIKSTMESDSVKQVEGSSIVNVSMEEGKAQLGHLGGAFRSGDGEGGSALYVSETARFEESSDAMFNESISATLRFAESTPQAARLLSAKKRVVRESLMEPPSTPDALLSYAKQRIDDYSFRINEAYCDSSQLCVNCYALRVELENITKKLSLLSEEHEKCQMIRNVGESSLECIGQLKVDDELKQKAELQERYNEQSAELEQLRYANERLLAENVNLKKDIDDYRFVMEGEVAKWKNTTNELKKRVFDLEGQLEARINIEEDFETAKIQLKAQFDEELVMTRQQFEKETIDARSLVDKNVKLEMDRLKEEVLSLRDQLAEERSNLEEAVMKLATASSEKEQLINAASTMEKSSLAVEECEFLRRKVESLEGELEQQHSSEENKLALLQKERNELLAKVAKLEEDLQGELETKEIIQDALKGSEELKNDLAEQLVTMEETSTHQVNQLYEKISELEKELSEHSHDQQMDVQVAIDERAALLVKLDHCEAELEGKESSLKALQSELDQLAEEKKRLIEASETREQLIEELRRERDQLVHQVAQQGSAASEYLEMEISQKASLQREIDSLRKELSTVVEQTAAIVSDAVRAEFEKESKEKVDEIARLESVKRKLEQQLEEMGAKAHQAELEKERKELRLEQLETDLAGVRRAAEESKADFERLLQANSSEWENKVAHWRDLNESKERLVKELAESMKSQAAELVKANVEEKIKWLQERAVQSDAELKSLKGELTQAYQQIEKEYSLAREKDEHLLALRIEAHDLKAMIESVKAEKEAAEHRMEQVTVELTKMVEAQKAQEKRVKVAEDMAARRISEVDERSRALEAALTEARSNEARIAKELGAQMDEAHTLRERLRSVNEKMESERSKEHGKVEILQAELDRWKREVELLRANTLRATLLEKELDALRTEREADLAKMKAELMESLRKCDSANSARDDAARRIEELELKLAKAQESAHATSLSKENEEEVEELRRRIAMLESENDRMGAACDEADDEIKTLREETLELRRKLAFKDGLTSEEVARRLGNIQPFCPVVIEETVTSIDDTSADDTAAEKTANGSGGSSKLKTKSPFKKSKSSKKDEPAGEQQSCRTQ
uniref:Uncharacterized protein n=1 Tax=Parascaris univalens TaxID=6257 RepID=A0A915AYY0_PARUN